MRQVKRRARAQVEFPQEIPHRHYPQLYRQPREKWLHGGLGADMPDHPEGVQRTLRESEYVKRD